MGSKNDLLRNGWITLLASFAFMAALALSGRASAADIEHAVAWDSCGPVNLATR